ncbi:feruloyl-CoA synthase [Aquabacterium sp. J223]|uniref:feruloyl-CoA synthase n=1 Tax=Aquabacterium sp. J223 TaxID=2898431 RepID=UPI0021AD60F2|nr:feruloyl-CoA synthase [Aquabacterium sp. J223]UUX94470.1 feruloyl-CoA synthase [Aquabacterium sp. J223]
MDTRARRLSLAEPELAVERRRDGSMVLRSPQPLGLPERCVGDWLTRWAAATPDRVFLAERRDGAWFELPYARALDEVRRLAQGLLDQGLGPDAPLMVLSDNSVEHALIALAAMHVGVPVVPVSPAYSLSSSDHAKLRQVAELIAPGLVYADGARFAPALAALRRPVADVTVLRRRPPTTAVDEAHARVGPDTVAKVLLTSGSTGTPKGVINTQRMLTTNQQQARQVWPFVLEQPPVLVDWLPWNHTFGGNFNLHLVLANGGTFYIDGGKPVPGLIDHTLANLREVAPTMYFNVPRGFDLLLPVLEQDEALRRRFFSRCGFLLYAGAALPEHLWRRLAAMAKAERGEDVLLASSWGSTETAPLVVAVHAPVAEPGIVGLPVPGCELKLVPSAGKLEARVRGPQVTPGYWRRDDLSAAAFDDEGFYRMGDALRFADAGQPARGLVFDGRIAEDFKLRTGTWVHVGALRTRLLAAADPLVQDAVIAGHDRDEVGALLFLNPARVDGLSPTQVHDHLARALTRLNAGGGSSVRIARARVLAEPPRIALGEITDKGYLNQRAVLQHRADDVTRLYDDADADLIRPAASD